MTMERWLTLIAALVLAACGGGDGEVSQPPPVLQALPKVSLPQYELIQNSGPVVVLMATSINETLYTQQMGSLVSDLTTAGFSLLALDLPCHGLDADDSPGPLDCWRKRIEGGDRNIFRDFCAGLSAVLDSIGAKSADVVGLSRGGYVAVTCAAYDSRIHNIALLIPVTDLQRLTEFDGFKVDQQAFGLSQYLPFLKDRNILARVSRNDTRVGTDAAVAFAKSVGATLQMLDVDGHFAPEDGSTTRWLSGH